jgi:hypothetical protein
MVGGTGDGAGIHLPDTQFFQQCMHGILLLRVKSAVSIDAT